MHVVQLLPCHVKQLTESHLPGHMVSRTGNVEQLGELGGAIGNDLY